MSTIGKPRKTSGIIFITGTDTGVGKTVFTALLLAHLREQGVRALAMKPFCSGGRGDVRLLQSLQRGELSDDEVNPFYYDLPLAPCIAARQGRGPKVQLREAVRKIDAIKKKCDVLLVEGSGGLLVPLGESFTVLELIKTLACPVLVLGRNKIGIINHTLMSIELLHAVGIKLVTSILMGAKKSDISVRFNAGYLRDKIDRCRVFELPFLGPELRRVGAIKRSAKKIKKVLARFCMAASVSTSSIRKTVLIDKKPVDGRRGER